MNKEIIQKEIIQIITKKTKKLNKETKQMIINEINNYLKNNSMGILILSSFDEKGKMDLKINITRTHEKHIEETLKELFKRNPKIKQKIKEILEEEYKECMKTTKTMVS